MSVLFWQRYNFMSVRGILQNIVTSFSGLDLVIIKTPAHKE